MYMNIFFYKYEKYIYSVDFLIVILLFRIIHTFIIYSQNFLRELFCVKKQR